MLHANLLRAIPYGCAYRNLPFYGTFSRHGRPRTSSGLLIWLNENVPFYGTFSRHGRPRTSSGLLIWLNENVRFPKDFFQGSLSSSDLNGTLTDFLQSNILKKISSKDLPMVCFVVTQHSESELSLCLRYSKTSCEATKKNSDVNSDDPMIDFWP